MQLRELKDDVKAVVDALAAAGITVQHTVMLDAISKGFGERGWLAHREALASLAQAAGSKSAAPLTSAPVAKPWKQEDGPMSDEQYVALRGCRCPFCGSGNIEAETPEADGDDAWELVHCHDCDKDWTDLFKLRGYVSENSGDAAEDSPEAAEENVEDNESSTEGGSGFFADGEFVSVWDGGYEIASRARLNLETGLVDVIELVDTEEVTTLDEQFFRVANAPDYKFSLVTNKEGAFIGQARLKQIRRLLRVENPNAKTEFSVSGMSLAETYSCVSGRVVERFTDGTTRESVEQCLILNGAVVSYDPVRRRQVNDAGATVVSRHFVPSLDLAQAEPLKFPMAQMADAGKWPMDPYNECFHLEDEDLQRLRSLVRQGKLIVGAVELAALLSRIQQLQAGKASYEMALQSGEAWKINAAKELYGKHAQWELDFLTELHEATVKGYQVD